MSGIQGLYDRGATPYFHGRKPILSNFENLLVTSKKTKGGTIFIIQGPPGVGKTALLSECWDMAEAKKWEVSEIDPNHLWNTGELGKILGIRRVRRGMIPSPETVIQAKRKPLLLILDEAQHLGEDGGPPKEHRKSVCSLLKKIHNGSLGKPVILLAGGLGITRESFEALGISKKSEDCMYDMGPLTGEEDRGIVRDWLLKEGKAKGDIRDWVDAITRESYRWARDVHTAATHAARLVKGNDGVMTEELLRLILEEGRETRLTYREDRLESFDAEERRSLARVLMKGSEEIGVAQDIALEQMTQEYGEKEGKDILFLAVHRGVLHVNRDAKTYYAPIPAMREYLIKNYPPKEMGSPMKEQYSDIGAEPELER